MDDVSEEAAFDLGSLEKAVGKVLTDMYSCSPDSSQIRAEIETWIRGEFHRYGLPAPKDIVFESGWDDEKGCYCLHANVRMPVEAKEVIIEFTKVLSSAVDGERDDCSGGMQS